MVVVCGGVTCHPRGQCCRERSARNRACVARAPRRAAPCVRPRQNCGPAANLPPQWGVPTRPLLPYPTSRPLSDLSWTTDAHDFLSMVHTHVSNDLLFLMARLSTRMCRPAFPPPQINCKFPLKIHFVMPLAISINKAKFHKMSAVCLSEVFAFVRRGKCASAVCYCHSC